MNFENLFKKIIGIQRKNICVCKNCGRLKAGKRVSIGKCTKVFAKRNAKIFIESGCTLSDNGYIVAVSGSVHIGKGTYFNRNAVVVCQKKIYIGKNCSIGPGVTIYDHDHKIGAHGKIDGYNASDVVIGDNCWIGANAIILRGSTIGDNVVIGAGAVVKGNVRSNVMIVPNTKNREIDLLERYGD